jgi:hypothetical protein
MAAMTLSWKSDDCAFDAFFKHSRSAHAVHVVCPVGLLVRDSPIACQGHELQSVELASSASASARHTPIKLYHQTTPATLRKAR